jgi:hypothetical protein
VGLDTKYEFVFTFNEGILMKAFLSSNYPPGWTPTINKIKLLDKCDANGYVFDLNKMQKNVYNYITTDISHPLKSIECGDIQFNVTHDEPTDLFEPVTGVCSKFLYVARYKNTIIYEVCLFNAKYVFRRIYKLLHTTCDSQLLLNYVDPCNLSVYLHYCS